MAACWRCNASPERALDGYNRHPSFCRPIPDHVHPGPPAAVQTVPGNLPRTVHRPDRGRRPPGPEPPADAQAGQSAGLCAGPGVSQPGGAGRGPGQERRRHRRVRPARFRLHRDRHRHSATAAGQSQAAPVPPAASQRDHQSHGFQQPRRRPPAGAGACSEVSRRAGDQHRQELRYPGGARGRRLPDLPGQGLRRRQLRHRQRRARRTRPACAACSSAIRSSNCWRHCASARKRWRCGMAGGYRWRSRSPRT